MRVMALNKEGEVVEGTLAGGAPGVVRLIDVSTAIDRKSWGWEMSAQVEGSEILVDASTVESLC